MPPHNTQHDTTRPPYHTSTIYPRPDQYEVPSYVPIAHGAYNPLTRLNDIALLKISAYSKYPPVRLQTPALASLTEPGTTVTASGWGATVRTCVCVRRWMQCTSRVPGLGVHHDVSSIHCGWAQ